jgi:hypothetical protein
VPLKYWGCVHIGLLDLLSCRPFLGSEEFRFYTSSSCFILSLHDSSLVQVLYVPLILEAVPLTTHCNYLPIDNSDFLQDFVAILRRNFAFASSLLLPSIASSSSTVFPITSTIRPSLYLPICGLHVSRPSLSRASAAPYVAHPPHLTVQSCQVTATHTPPTRHHLSAPSTPSCIDSLLC